MNGQAGVEVLDGFAQGDFADTAFDRLDDQGLFCPADIRAQLTGVRDDCGVDLRVVLATGAESTPASHEHVCDGSAACYPGGRPDGAQACRPLDETEQRRLRDGTALAGAVLRGDVDWRTLPVIN